MKLAARKMMLQIMARGRRPSKLSIDLSYKLIPRLALHMSIFECSSRPEPEPHASAPTCTSSLHCHGGSKRSGTAGGDDSGQGQAPTTIHREQQEDGSEAGPTHFLSLRIHLESSIKASNYSS
ncbi:hypothetical protein EJB05_20506 [Eragrostis curvula]|uniref:Uncharacterized protein n=1 Tax=Eragrostis curvula TaxID=38414 RepID=A0A5J9UZ91_9POAL|nr:hypothetical protein EJB05_20506 [Eragrostis curvula]